jgi:ABC-type phosphate/phosphonate transport system permease subunit
MRSSHAIAIWLFERLGLDVALVGDLLEECSGGRSAIWYWRQVLIAVWIGIWVAIRDHKVLALRAVAIGFATEFLFIFLWDFLGPDLPMFSVMQWIIQLSVTGWVVARTHRAHQVPTVLVFLICVFFFYVSYSFSWARILLVGSINNSRFRPYLAMYLMTIFMATVGVLLGGILAGPKKSLSGQTDPKLLKQGFSK